MRSVEPKVFLVAETEIRADELYRYLSEVGASGWTSDPRSPGELLAEVAGRLCYRSWKSGLNPNVTKVREGNREYIGNILAQRHGSVLEHASVSFIFHDVSRVFTHELVRHRAGVGISQESLRYVRLTDIGFWMPGALAVDSAVVERGGAVVRALEDFQRYLAERYGLDDPGRDFPLKKLITSAMRRFAPLGLATSILWTANHRTLRHVIEQRTSPHAEEEIRLVFDRVAQILTERFPAIYQDFERTSTGAWMPMHPKV